MWFRKKKNNEFDVALLLIFSSERFLTARKVYEAFHNGSAIGFQDDPFLLIQLQQYLADKKIRERLVELLKRQTN